ncbi:GNAT family acetyltransferase [Acinetobacter defluvii]|uniref:N-acetyltransferase n=1 Tax=Acinetobacter defluvii TaxID=1871111 RepID=UPI00149015B8|nr:N-acetyltransferase [Acinetobacter defluvii]NNP73037.1 GNAT family acetyltransferase [Acinetobacter defluvii]
MHLIRAAHADDITQMLKIWLDASTQAHHFIPAYFWQAQLYNMRDIYLPMAENHVIEQNGVVKGFVSLLKEAHYLATLFVAPESQGQGFGSQLLQFLQQQSTELNLQVYTANTNAVQFYQKHAFQIVRESRDVHTEQPQFDMYWSVHSIQSIGTK